MVSKTIIDEEKKRAWKNYEEKLLNLEFARSRFVPSRYNYQQTLLNKDMVRESISKRKIGKTAELAGVVSEMVKTGVEKA